MITISMDVRSAAAVRQALFDEQKRYTYDPKCVPPRIVEIRNVINDLDEQIEKQTNAQKHLDKSIVNFINELKLR